MPQLRRRRVVKERARAHERDLLIAWDREAREQTVDEFLGFLPQHPGQPQRPQPECERNGRLGIAGVNRILGCRAEVRVIRVQRGGELGGRAAGVKAIARRGRERREVPPVPGASLPALPAVPEALSGECAHELEQLVPLGPRSAPDEARIEQLAELRPRGRVDDGVESGGGEPTEKHRRPGEHGLSLRAQQFIAPGDRRLEGLLTIRKVAERVLADRQRLGELVGDLRRPQCLRPGRGELDRQGQTVEGATDARGRIASVAASIFSRRGVARAGSRSILYDGALPSVTRNLAEQAAGSGSTSEFSSPRSRSRIPRLVARARRPDTSARI